MKLNKKSEVSFLKQFSNKRKFSINLFFLEKNNFNLNEIPIEKAYYIVGFADREGSFNICFRKKDDYLIGQKLSPVFNISQKEKTILTVIKKYLKCGTIRFKKDNVYVYEVDNKNALIHIIIPFFSKYKFLSDKKKKDFSRFLKLVKIVSQENKSKTYSDIQNVLKLLTEISSTSSRKYSNFVRGTNLFEDILERAALFYEKNKAKIDKLNIKSSETTRQT